MRSSELTYTPAWWVPSAHLQTLWGRFRRVPSVATRTERWHTPDNDELELQRLDASPSAGPHVPRLVLLHGLEGTIRSHYLQGTLHHAQQKGWAADVIIFRGCNGQMNRSRRMYHSGETTDLDFVVHQLIAQHPNQPILLAGFSLGGNVLLKWLGELGNKVPVQVRAAAAVSVPFDLERGSRHIESGFARLYTWHFLRSLKRKAESKLLGFPGAFDVEALRACRTLHDFDDAVTAPLHGFANAHAYYSHSSARHYLSRIQRPTLLLSSTDDPFLPRSVADDVAILARSNRLLTVEMLDAGGHVGFVGGRNPFRPRFYAEERIIEFLSCSAPVTPVFCDG